MTTMELGKVDGSIRLTLKNAGVGVTGLTSGDLDIKYFTIDTSDTMAGFSLAEVDATNFPGVYLLTDYPEELVSFAGPAGLLVTGSGFDDHEVELEISEAWKQIRKMYQLSYMNLVWNVDESRWDLLDESDTLLGWFPGEDINGNPAVIDGTHPVSRLLFVPAP